MDPAVAIALTLLKPSEGCKLRPYRDSAGVWTIGWGTIEIDGKPVTADTAPITQARADALMAADVASRVQAIRAAVKVPAQPCEIAAFVDFAYNEGLGAFRSSALLKKFNEGDKTGCAAQFLVWDKVRDPSTHELVDSTGLENRRKREVVVFNGGKAA